MFCPNCGRDNSRETKFCAACGTNLEIVSQALSGNKDDFFTKTDAALDHLLARYAEHIFKDAPSKLNTRRVKNSWKILGQGAVTSFVDVILFFLMWNIMPLRFLVLLISTPFKLLSQRNSRQVSTTAGLAQKSEQQLAEPSSNKWIAGSFPSVSEHTTQHLDEYRQAEHRRVVAKD